MNQGHIAGAGIAAHLHQHVVPRWPGDQNFMPIIGRTKTLPELLSDTRGCSPGPGRRDRLSLARLRDRDRGGSAATALPLLQEAAHVCALHHVLGCPRDRRRHRLHPRRRHAGDHGHGRLRRPVPVIDRESGRCIATSSWDTEAHAGVRRQGRAATGARRRHHGRRARRRRMGGRAHASRPHHQRRLLLPGHVGGGRPTSTGSSRGSAARCCPGWRRWTASAAPACWSTARAAGPAAR